MMKSLFTAVLAFLLLFPILSFAQSDYWTRVDSTTLGFRSIHAVNDSTLIASVYNGYGFLRSTNAGLTWHRTDTTGHPTFYQIRTLDDGSLYVGTGTGTIKKSTDQGATWQSITVSSSYPVRTVAMDMDNRYFAGTEGNYSYRTTDTCQTWQVMNSTSGLFRPYVYSFLPLSSTLIAGSYCGGAFLSTNHGETWTQKVNGLNGADSGFSSQINSLMFFPPNTVVAADGYDLFTSRSGGLFFTDTTCSRWRLNLFSYDHGYDQCFLSLYKVNDILFIGMNRMGIGRSDDHGASWEWLNTGLPRRSLTDTTFAGVYDFCTDGQGRVFAATTGGIYRLDHYSSTGEMQTHFSLPSEIQLAQNFPNPFNGGTSIAFGVTNPGNVTLHVFDRLGRLVATPVQSRVASGMHRIEFAMPKDAPSGAYFYRLETNGTSAVKTMMYTK